MVEVRAETEIAATPERVWSVLTDLPRYCAWNPFLRDVQGSAQVGCRVRVRMQPSQGLPVVFHADVLYSEKDRALRWRGHLFAPVLACGDHRFTIEELPNGNTRFVQIERFHGLVSRVAKQLIAREAKHGFDAMNAALKARAEGEAMVATSSLAAAAAGV